MSDDLKPCPFCGEDQTPHDNTSWVRCRGCGAETGWRATGDEAIAAWNIRREFAPVVIDAIQYGPYHAPTLELCTFLDGSGASYGPEGITIPTLEGNHLARPGDWIIKGVAGEFYSCKPEIFEQTYELVEGGE